MFKISFFYFLLTTIYTLLINISPNSYFDSRENLIQYSQDWIKEIDEKISFEYYNVPIMHNHHN